jgi:hypothetical protein
MVYKELSPDICQHASLHELPRACLWQAYVAMMHIRLATIFAQFRSRSVVRRRIHRLLSGPPIHGSFSTCLLKWSSLDDSVDKRHS